MKCLNDECLFCAFAHNQTKPKTKNPKLKQQQQQQQQQKESKLGPLGQLHQQKILAKLEEPI